VTVRDPLDVRPNFASTATRQAANGDTLLERKRARPDETTSTAGSEDLAYGKARAGHALPVRRPAGRPSLAPWLHAEAAVLAPPLGSTVLANFFFGSRSHSKVPRFC
jgi:hypothetical protein